MTFIQHSYFMLGAFCGFLIIDIAFALAFISFKKAKRTAESKLPDDVKELQECYTLLLKTARRCARDLRHATDMIDSRKNAEIVTTFHDRYTHYETVFGGTDEYRHHLHREIEVLRNEVEEWKSFSEPDQPQTTHQ